MWLVSCVSWGPSIVPWWCSLGGIEFKNDTLLGESSGLDATLSWGDLDETPWTPSSCKYWAPAGDPSMLTWNWGKHYVRKTNARHNAFVLPYWR